MKLTARSEASICHKPFLYCTDKGTRLAEHDCAIKLSIRGRRGEEGNTFLLGPLLVNEQACVCVMIQYLHTHRHTWSQVVCERGAEWRWRGRMGSGGSRGGASIVQHRWAWRCVQETECEKQVIREQSRCKPCFGTVSCVCEEGCAAMLGEWTMQRLDNRGAPLLPDGAAV